MLVIFTLVHQTNLEWQGVYRFALLFQHLSSVVRCLRVRSNLRVCSIVFSCVNLMKSILLLLLLLARLSLNHSLRSHNQPLESRWLPATLSAVLLLS